MGRTTPARGRRVTRAAATSHETLSLFELDAPPDAAQPAPGDGVPSDAPADPTDGAERDRLRAKALLVHQRLCAEYGCPIQWFHHLDPLGELVSSMLSHRTKNADSGRAFRRIRERFPTWEAVRDAPVAELEEAIAPVTWPELKAPRIQQVLRLVGERRGGTLSLDFLAGLPVREAREWLETLPGVGRKTSAAVLLFSTLRMPALPVDSHHHRVAQRLGLIGPEVAVGPSHAILEAQLPADWSAQQVYDNHEALMLHGQHVCHWRSPACDRCVVLDVCPEGKRRVQGAGCRVQGAGCRVNDERAGSSSRMPARRAIQAFDPSP